MAYLRIDTLNRPVRTRMPGGVGGGAREGPPYPDWAYRSEGQVGPTMETMVLANRFAKALDAEDYSTAAQCLAATCLYETQEETHRGPDAIIGSYREHGEWAATNLDSVRYESAVRGGNDGEAIVEFLDHIEHAGVAHTYRCEQRLTFDGLGRISRIRHVDLPGERERLRLFFRKVGLDRSQRSEENG